MKSQNPWMGRAKGSAGGMTSSKVYDKNVLKAKAFEVNNPKTAAQQNQRTFFKEVSDLVNQLTEEQCRFLCPKAPKGMSRRNLLSKQLASYVTTSSGQKVVDIANVKTLGNAKEVDIKLDSIAVSNGTIYIDWVSDEGYLKQKINEYPSFVVMNKDKKQIIVLNSSDKISEDSTSFTAPSNWANDEDIYGLIFLTGATTPLTGFGTMGVIERPAR